MSNLELMNEYLKKQNKISEQTKKTYIQTATTLPFNITTTQPTIIKKLKELYTNPNTLSLYLNMIILLRRDNNLEHNKLVKLRNDLREEIISIRKENMSDSKNTLPSYKEIIDKLKDMNGIRYVINYLILEYGLRNKDINLLYVNKLPNEQNENENYISKSKNGYKLTINDFKTEKSFGTKIIDITDKKFKEEFNKLNIKDNSYLIPKKNGDKLKINSFNDKIINLTVDGLGEVKLFKIHIKYLLDTKDFDKLEELVNTRGTSLATILKSYNVYNNDMKKNEKKNETIENEVKSNVKKED